MSATYKTPGRIHSSNSEKVLYELLCIISQNSDITIDMSETNYIGSSALRIFLMANKTLSLKGEKHLQFINVNDYVKSVFEITGFDSILKIE